MEKLLFVDTNIYLDFYRLRNEISLDFLDKLKTLKNNLIVTYQVEMEFKKNRQSVILETLKNIQNPKNLPRVGILSEDENLNSIQSSLRDIETRLNNLRLKLQQILEEPLKYDDVYQTFEDIFSKTDELALKEKSAEQNNIINSAYNRFICGCPPKKKSDNSIGDAINWEWIIYLASLKKTDVCIVSRDSDFGIEYKNKYYLNDYLKDEFNKIVNKNAIIYFTGKLSEAFETFDISVTKVQEKAEDALITRVYSMVSAKKYGRYVHYLRNLNKEDQYDEVESCISDTQYDLENDELICSLMAETNAFDWDVDYYEILDIVIEDELAFAKISFQLIGVSDMDRPFCGDKIEGTAKAEIDGFGNVSYTDVEAKIEDWGD